VKRRLRSLLLRILVGIGVLDAWRNARRNDVVILMLHGTADPDCPSSWVPLRSQHAPEDIDWALRVLSRHYRFVSLDDAVEMLTGRRSSVDHTLVLTFDDGYRNNIVDALPVLKKHGAPMSVFLTVSHIDNRAPMWFDRLDYALQAVPADGWEARIGQVSVTISAKNRAELTEAYALLRNRAKKECRDEREFVDGIAKLCERLERVGGRTLSDTFEGDPWSQILTWEEVEAASRDGVIFGSHGRDHFRLGLLPGEEAWEQLKTSRDEIVKRLGACRFLAYPDGSYTQEIMKLGMECGYEAAVTTEEGRNKLGCDPMSLKRITFPSIRDETELLCRVSGFSDSASLRRIKSFFSGMKESAR